MKRINSILQCPLQFTMFYTFFTVHIPRACHVSCLQHFTFFEYEFNNVDYVNNAFWKFNFWRHHELIGSVFCLWSADRFQSGRVGSQKICRLAVDKMRVRLPAPSFHLKETQPIVNSTHVISRRLSPKSDHSKVYTPVLILLIFKRFTTLYRAFRS